MTSHLPDWGIGASKLDWKPVVKSKVANCGNEVEVATCYQCWAVIRNKNRSLTGMGAVLRITMVLKMSEKQITGHKTAKFLCWFFHENHWIFTVFWWNNWFLFWFFIKNQNRWFFESETIQNWNWQFYNNSNNCTTLVATNIFSYHMPRLLLCFHHLQLFGLSIWPNRTLTT
jgi:hypothetical protein